MQGVTANETARPAVVSDASRINSTALLEYAKEANTLKDSIVDRVNTHLNPWQGVAQVTFWGTILMFSFMILHLLLLGFLWLKHKPVPGALAFGALELKVRSVTCQMQCLLLETLALRPNGERKMISISILNVRNIKRPLSNLSSGPALFVLQIMILLIPPAVKCAARLYLEGSQQAIFVGCILILLIPFPIIIAGLFITGWLIIHPPAVIRGIFYEVDSTSCAAGSQKQSWIRRKFINPLFGNNEETGEWKAHHDDEPGRL